MPVPALTHGYGHAVDRPGGESVGRPAADPGRVAGLDGLRGLAALFVVVHHCWVLSFRGRYPLVNGPEWLGWLLHGRFAVVFFITLSGFSLAIAPARHGWRLGGARRYAQRRAWRILPPYWAALVFSLFVAYTWTRLPLSDPPTGRSVVVYGLLLQDFVPAPAPNAVFWSIAVEAALYVAFPLLLIVRRWAGAAAMLAAVVVPVVVVGLLVPAMSTTPTTPATAATPMQSWFTFELAPLFAMGVVAAGVVAAGERVRRTPWHWLALLAAAPVLLLIVVQGSVWTVAHYYWIELALGPAIALLLAAVATRRPAPLTWLLATRPVVGLGRFSYSLYLIHLPIVLVISRKIVAPHVPPGLPRFWVTLALATPVSVVAAWVFASVFEIPFQRYRSWAALRAAVATAVRTRRSDPA